MPLFIRGETMMTQLRIALPDGSARKVPAGSTPLDVARSIGEDLARQAVAARVDGQLVDLDTRLEQDARLELVTLNSPEGLDVYRHSTAHLMAHAVKELYGDQVQVTIGPAIENGFYYDFYSPDHYFTPEDFAAIEKKMEELAAADLPIRREELSRDSAIARFREMGETFKVELIEDLAQCHGLALPAGGICRSVPRSAPAFDRVASRPSS